MTRTRGKVIDDIFTKVLGDGTFKVTEEQAQEFGDAMRDLALARFSGKDREPGVSASNFGHPCSRKLWYNVNAQDDCESVGPQLRLKFLYGDLVEELVLFLVKLSGHEVTGQQDVMKMYGMKGSRDCLIDGQSVDVKSASGYGVRKFENHELAENDPFAYLPQISFYRHAATDSGDDVKVEGAAFLVIDKVTGNMVWDEYTDDELYTPEELEAGIQETTEQVYERNMPPVKAFEAEPMGTSGNMKLCTSCRYCSAKWACWPALRAFQYARELTYLTRVVKRPADRIPDVTAREKGALIA